MVSEAEKNYFKDSAIELKRPETMQEAMKDNTKYVIVEKGTNPTLVLDNRNGIMPIKPKTITLP